MRFHAGTFDVELNGVSGSVQKSNRAQTNHWRWLWCWSMYKFLAILQFVAGSLMLILLINIFFFGNTYDTPTFLIAVMSGWFVCAPFTYIQHRIVVGYREESQPDYYQEEFRGYFWGTKSPG